MEILKSENEWEKSCKIFKVDCKNFRKLMSWKAAVEFLKVYRKFRMKKKIEKCLEKFIENFVPDWKSIVVHFDKNDEN